jgi:hypothetical protein
VAYSGRLRWRNQREEIMIITNKFDLPSSVLNALHRPTYSKGNAHISCTELLNSPRIVQLKRKHWEDIEQDASEMVWQLFGSAIHQILEHGKGENHIIEERLFAEFSGWVLSGAIDLQTVTPDGIEISDYKTCGSYSVVNEKADWTYQLNIYAHLLETVKKIPVTKLSIVAIVRDWTARDTGRENYPQAPIVTIPIKLWSPEEREAFIQSRLTAHSSAMFEADTEGTLPECSPEEMWEKPSTWAIKKEGGVRAKSVHSTKEEAEVNLTKGYFIEHRPGERTRCKSYCQVSKFCSQFQTYLKENQSVDQPE